MAKFTRSAILKRIKSELEIAPNVKLPERTFDKLDWLQTILSIELFCAVEVDEITEEKWIQTIPNCQEIADYANKAEKFPRKYVEYKWALLHKLRELQLAIPNTNVSEKQRLERKRFSNLPDFQKACIEFTIHKIDKK